MTQGPAASERRLPVLLAAVGLLLCLLLFGVHAQTYLRPTRESFCELGKALDCATVAASPESVVLGLPWAVWGSAGYLGLLLAALRRSKWLLPLSAVAALTSLYLLFLSVTRVGALCLLCEGVHVVSFVLFFVVLRDRALLLESLQNRQGWTAVLLLPGLLLLSTWLVLPPYWTVFSFHGQPHLPTGMTPEGHHFIGSPSPRLVVHEFTDYQCPHCKVASTRSLRLVSKHPDVQLVRHDTPRMNCQKGVGACLATRAAICADQQDKFWQADRWLFAFANPRKPFDLDKMAVDLELDRQELSQCFEDDDTYAKAEAAFKFARGHKARYVPSYWIDGKRVEAQDLEERLR